ncbi:MAG: formylglycine-generating enzyme family protein [Bacteroidaceae bacterium]|nr:formylglycine-generating enzyme family protein [Bacteroidaceae bacterium]
MKTMRRLFFALPVLAMAMTMSVSCTSDDEIMEQPVQDPSTEERVPRYAVMNLEGGKVPFDTTTRTATADWDDEARIYLQFTVGTKLVDGVATYSNSAQEWTVEYYGDLTEGVETKCEAYYFENAGDATFSNVALTEHTAIYADKAAVYIFEDNTLTVMASLTPMTGRIRFKGDVAQEYRVTGFKYYNSYDIATNSFTSTSGTFISSTQDNGYSEYYYGFFPNESNKEIYFEDTDNHVTFLRTLNEKALAVGRGGYLDIPTIDNRSGWKLHKYKEITVSNVTFRMVRVLATDSWSYYNNWKSFYIGETEVTQELWKAIMGTSNNPSNFKGNNLPVENIGYDDCLTFIEKLNSKTGLTFKVPTYEQWQYAFKGACISKNYTYSGSNNVDDVAWHSGNSNNTTHEVKTKQPNEIGIYDMSGNVFEYVIYGSAIYAYGGSWDTRSEYCHDNSNTYTLSLTGFRLCLDI